MSSTNEEKHKFTVDLKFNVQSHFIHQSMVLKIINELQQIPSLINLKLDPEITLYCCNVLENLIKKSDKVNKKNIVIDAFTKIFNLNPTEINTIGTQIDFLFNNKKIKKIKMRKYIYNGVSNWIKRKFL